jgi:signal transduction histidine kinase
VTIASGTVRARILIVEDESIVALDLASTLEHLGYEVVGTAATADDAVRLATTEAPDLVLMDIQLNGARDGAHAADQIRRELGVPVVYLTAFSDSATLERAQITEPYGYLLKPFGERELQVTIQIALYRHRAQREHEQLLREQAARAALEKERAWTQFLADATSAISSSLDVGQIQQTFTRVLVPAVADLAALHVRGGTNDTVAIAHREGKEAHVWELLRRYPIDPNLPFGFQGVLRSGQPELVEFVSPEILQRFAADAENLRLLQGLQLTSWLCFPLIIRGEIYGAVTLAMLDSSRRFTPADVGRMLELGRRGSAAIENARLYQLAQEAIAVREEFLSVAAHELRTPISAILLALFGMQRLTEHPDHAVVHKKIAQVIQQFDRLTALVDRLLDVTRIRSGLLEIHPEEFDLAQCMRDVAARFAEQATRQGTAIHVHGPEHSRGSWDQLRIEQVLTNLIANALKFCERRPIDIELDEAENSVSLTVRDSGIGIAPERLPHIFERFERGVSARHYGGLGLGLYVTRRIVEAHGGTIEVRSAPDQGSMFRVQLPRPAATPSAAP